MNFKIFFLFFLPICQCQLYKRIPKNYVDTRIEYFLAENSINNCFEYRENLDTLLLKCWRDNQLVNVKINIQNQIYSIPDYSLSVMV
tara:strand:+ start:6017 stop:6277 length:261 start_codon:yes stop_codon:yes gene_type:complete